MKRKTCAVILAMILLTVTLSGLRGDHCKKLRRGHDHRFASRGEIGDYHMER